MIEQDLVTSVKTSQRDYEQPPMVVGADTPIFEVAPTTPGSENLPDVRRETGSAPSRGFGKVVEFFVENLDEPSGNAAEGTLTPGRQLTRRGFLTLAGGAAVAVGIPSWLKESQKDKERAQAAERLAQKKEIVDGMVASAYYDAALARRVFAANKMQDEKVVLPAPDGKSDKEEGAKLTTRVFERRTNPKGVHAKKGDEVVSFMHVIDSKDGYMWVTIGTEVEHTKLRRDDPDRIVSLSTNVRVSNDPKFEELVLAGDTTVGELLQYVNGKVASSPKSGYDVTYVATRTRPDKVIFDEKGKQRSIDFEKNYSVSYIPDTGHIAVWNDNEYGYGDGASTYEKAKRILRQHSEIFLSILS